MTRPNSPAIETLYPAFPEITLISGQFLTVKLPDGQTIEIDTKDKLETDVFINNPYDDCYETMTIKKWEDDEPHPSLSAAERNTNLR